METNNAMEHSYNGGRTVGTIEEIHTKSELRSSIYENHTTRPSYVHSMVPSLGASGKCSITMFPPVVAKKWSM